MNEDDQFRKSLEKSIFNADPDKIDKIELLEDIFKTGVAKLFEFNLGKKGKDRLEFGVLVEIKKNLIRVFRGANLGEYQRSEKWYNELFESTVKEIFNDASHNHKGKDQIAMNQTLEINPSTYAKEGGLYVPKHLKDSL